MNRLKIKKVSKSYGKTLALDSVTTELNVGVTGLLGHNGAGKSTLIQILLGLLSKDTGEVIYNEKSIEEWGIEYNKFLSYVPQQLNLNMDLSVEGFLCYFATLKRVKDANICELLERLNLLTHRKKKVKQLSGGMKQRLLLAQALLNRPKILFLDEPTAGLDPFERKNLRNLLGELSEDMIIFLATHVISDLEFIANNLIFLKEGKLIAEGSQEHFAKSINVYESYEDEEILRKKNPQLIMVNKMHNERGVIKRFVSDIEIGNHVTTGLDDIYLGVLS